VHGGRVRMPELVLGDGVPRRLLRRRGELRHVRASVQHDRRNRVLGRGHLADLHDRR
jgi:hypothetical protein